MPSKYAPQGDELDSSYGAPVTAPAEGAAPAAEDKSVDQENQMATTALVPNKVLSPDGEPIEEGAEIVLRVVRNHGTESEVEYAPKKGSEEGPSDEGETTTGNEEAEIAALDTKE